MRTINLAGIVKTPFDKVRIIWEVDGCSGNTETEAWKGQSVIDDLVRAGYFIIGVEKV